MPLEMTEKPSTGYVLITFALDAALTGNNISIDINTNVSKLVVANVLRNLLTAIDKEDDGGTAQQ